MEVMRDGGADHLSRCFVNMPDKQAAALITVESLGQRTSYPERAVDPGLSLEACKLSDNGERRGHNRFSRRGAWIVG